MKKLSDELLENCTCTRLRTAARVVTRVYDDGLRSTGLRNSQVSVLAAVDATETISISALSKTLSMDRTTLSRNLKPLIAAALVTVSEEGWRRSKTVQITKSGKATLNSAFPLWQQAQQELIHRFGKKRWEEVDAQLQDLIAIY